MTDRNTFAQLSQQANHAGCMKDLRSPGILLLQSHCCPFERLKIATLLSWLSCRWGSRSSHVLSLKAGGPLQVTFLWAFPQRLRLRLHRMAGPVSCSLGQPSLTQPATSTLPLGSFQSHSVAPACHQSFSGAGLHLPTPADHQVLPCRAVDRGAFSMVISCNLWQLSRSVHPRQRWVS